LLPLARLLNSRSLSESGWIASLFRQTSGAKLPVKLMHETRGLLSMSRQKIKTVRKAALRLLRFSFPHGLYFSETKGLTQIYYALLVVQLLKLLFGLHQNWRLL
jgi:hypothetical protein